MENSKSCPARGRSPYFLLLALLGVLSLTGCQKKTSFANYRSAQEQVLLLASDKSDLSSGTSISIPIELSDLSGKLQIEEGATIADAATAAALNMGESGLNQAGPSINVSATTEVDYSQIGRLEISIPLSESAGLLQQSSYLAVLYQVKDAEGQILIGVIPSTNFRVANARATFKMLGFGNYQAVRLAQEIKEEVKVTTTETKVLTKSEQLQLPELAVAAISPIIAYKGQTITITGSNFRPGIKLAYLGRALGQVEVKSDSALTVVVDEAPRRGRGTLYLAQDGVERSFSLAYAGSSSDYPLMTAAASEICSGQKFYNANGELLEGTRSCTASAPSTPTYANCSQDGETGCITTATYKAAAMSAVQAANIAVGTTIAGVAGSGVLESHSSCTGANQSNCLATATYKTMDLSSAGAATGLTASNFNTSLKSAANFEFWDATGVRHSLAGDADLSAANIKSSIVVFGVTGTFNTSSTPCASDGESNCLVDGSTFAAAALSGLANKVLSSQTVAGVSGTVVLPAAGKVLTGISYGASNATTGTLTLPSANTVLAGSGSYGDPGAALTPSYSPDFPALANVRSLDTVNGAAGTLADCTAAGMLGCVTTTSFKSMDLSLAGSALDLTSGNFQTRISSGSMFEFWDASGTRHTFTGDADLTPASIKAGVVIHGFTGQYPSVSHPLASDTATTDFTLFYTQLSSPGNFEFFDSAGTRYTGSGDSDLLAANLKSGTEILGVTGIYSQSFTCPTGWIKVDGDSAYGTGGFCVMKYEAKNVSTVATSQAGGAPWVSTSQTAALSTCRSLGTGYDLISNQEWMTIGAHLAAQANNWTGGTLGSGSLYAGHTDSSPAQTCEASTSDTQAFVESTCTGVSSGDTAEQKRTFSFSSSDVIWDFSGNASEWVNYVNLSDKPTTSDGEYTSVTETLGTPLKHLIPTNAVKSFWNDTWNSTQKIGKYSPGTNGVGGALVRGGTHSENSAAGLFAANLANGPSSSYPYIGFRCRASLILTP